MRTARDAVNFLKQGTLSNWKLNAMQCQQRYIVALVDCGKLCTHCLLCPAQVLTPVRVGVGVGPRLAMFPHRLTPSSLKQSLPSVYSRCIYALQHQVKVLSCQEGRVGCELYAIKISVLYAARTVLEAPLLAKLYPLTLLCLPYTISPCITPYYAHTPCHTVLALPDCIQLGGSS